MQRIITIGLMALVIFLATGTPSLISLLNSESLPETNNPLINSKAVSLTPIAIFLVALGVSGVYMLYLAGVNVKPNRSLAIKQLIVSVNLIGGAWAGLEFLLSVALKQ